MALKTYPGRMTFGLLPEPEGRSGSFITSTVVNGMILATILILSFLIKPVVIEHKYEQTELILPVMQPPPPKIKVTPPPAPPPELPKPPEVKLEAPRIEMPKPKPVDLPKVQMEAKVNLPQVKAAKPQIILAPQP